MYEPTRFLIENYLSDAAFTDYDDAEFGVIGGVTKQGTGSAVMTADRYDASSGYTYYNDLLYTIQIDGVGAGKEIAQATFKWRTNETAPGAWEETGHATSTTLHELSYGAYVKWTAGTGDDFALNDIFQFTASASFALTKAHDERRDTVVKTKSATQTEYGWNLGESKRVRVIALFDVMVNTGSITDALYVRIQASDSYSSWVYSADFTLTEDNLLMYLDETYQYWLLTIKFGANRVVQIGQIYLGDYIELADRSLPDWGVEQTIRSRMITAQGDSGSRRATVYNNLETLKLSWSSISNTDLSTLRDLFLFARDDSDHQEHPVFVHLFSDDGGETLLWTNITSDFKRSYEQVNINTLTLTFEEVAKGYVV